LNVRSGTVEEQSRTESFRLKGEQVVERVKGLIHEGNVRRVIVKQDDRVVAEFPLTVGVVGALIAPMLAALGALAALLTECTIEIERSEPPSGSSGGESSEDNQAAA
jgi:hypothetical protein